MAKNEKGPQRPTTTPVDHKVLSADRRAQLTKQAEEDLAAEREQQAGDDWYDKELERLRRGYIPSAQYVRITIDAAPYVQFFMLDGVQYYPGYPYEVTRDQAAVLNEQCQRSWQHQDQIDGRDRYQPYRREQGMKIGVAQMGTTTRGFATGATINADMSI
jgi:hypothetical protein